ncbi:MAG: trypsin-like serine protease [Aeromonadaceae bacterium]|nr:trypsin-like serine protease [Aeromonadaceae bacterium]
MNRAQKITPWLLALLCASPTMAATSTRVVSGQTSAANAWPYIMHIVDDRESSLMGRHYCGGGYLGDGLAVTARHCVFTDLILGQKICIGNQHTLNRNNCYAITAYRKFDNNEALALTGTSQISGDIALLQLASVPAQMPMLPLPTAEQDSNIVAGERLTALGYGSTSYASYRPSTWLQQLDITAASTAECAGVYADSTGVLTQDSLCSQAATVGSAPGDSGTPIMFWRNNSPIAAGLVSEGVNQNTRYVRYPLYYSWLAQVASEWRQSSAASTSYYHLITDEATPTATLTLRNWNNATASLTATPDSASSLLSIAAGQCQNLAPMATCDLTVNLTPGISSRQQETLTYQIGNWQQQLTLIADSASELSVPASWSVPDSRWWTSNHGPPWQAGAGSEELALTDLANDDYSELAMQVTGPGTLSFTLATGATGNLAGVMVKVDDKEQRLLNNNCLDQGYSLTIPAGSHKISWLGYNHSGSTSGSLARLGNVSWPSGSSYSADPSCSLLTSATTNPDNDVVESDSGGGSLGWPVLGLLTGLAFWRRRRV